MTRHEPSRLECGDVLGVPVSSVTMTDAVARIAGWIDKGRRAYVCVTGVHGIMECRRDPALRGIHARADMVTPDGMPLVWLLRLSGDRHIERVYGPDLMRAVTAMSIARGYRHFYYGGAESVAERLVSVLRGTHPALNVAGTLCPPFRPLTTDEDRAQVDAINAARPDIVWVGLSTPKQERWMADHLGRIEAPVLIGVGAAFDFLAGTKRQAPRWIQRNGLEWLFRLCSEPRRLWRRYAYIVPGFLLLAGREFGRRALGPGLPRRQWSRTE
jgi:N-acetylglucosaminyldiphosphoundecaprenol N-acetyl-beta-D-mannosaminyltransferase